MENKDSNLSVVVLKEGIALRKMQDVRAIRVKSDKYNLLIMKDYAPIVGEINGNVIIEGLENVSFNNIRAFYCLRKNLFHLIIKSDLVSNAG